MTTPWPDPPGTPEPREMVTGSALYLGQNHNDWARDKRCGCGVWQGEECDCAAVIAEYISRMESPVHMRQIDGRWEAVRR